MGGQSFKCPFCAKWFLSRRSLRDHVKGRYGMANFTIEGTGPVTEVVPLTLSGKRQENLHKKVASRDGSD
jgi:hypothetical protein